MTTSSFFGLKGQMKFKKQKKQTTSKLTDLVNKLKPDIEKIVNDLGYGLVNVSFVNENDTNYLRITISHRDHVISTDDCELVSKEIEKFLDKKDMITFSYLLEVESPGLSEKILNVTDDTGKHEFVLGGKHV